MTTSSRIVWWVAAVALVLLWSPPPTLAAIDYQITDIRFIGNEKTRPETLLRELSFTVGTVVSAAQIEEGRKSIMALGLFTAVGAWLQPTEAGHKLWITVQEKHFFLPVPILHLSADGDWTYGVMSRADNLLGLNQQLKTMFRRKVYRSAEIEREDRLEIKYQTPRIADGPLGLELGLYRERSLLSEARKGLAGRYERQLISSRVTASRWLLPAGTSNGWRMSAGLKREIYKHTLLSGDAGLFFDASISTFLARLENQMVVASEFRRTGQHYGYELQMIISGARRPLNQHFVFFRNYKDLGLDKPVQLHSHLRAGACSGSVFGDPCFSLGGGTTIRGIRRNALEGDMFVLANMQLLIPLAQHIRSVAFLDVGAATDSMSKSEPRRTAVGAGIGLVWKVRKFVRTDIRIELARGLGTNGGNHIYAATSMLF